MGKKGKVNKLAKMSDEERARYLQHRADMEEEARRRKRELISRFIRNKLEKEEAYSRMNTAKINQGWRYILRKIKCKQMMQDIKGLQSSFNYVVERKDRQIQSLIRALEDADEQHRRAFQAHTETLSYFLNVGTIRLDKLHDQYELQKNTLMEHWDREETEITDNHEKAEFQMKLVLFIQRRDYKNYMKTKENERAQHTNDLLLEHEENLRALLKPKHQQIEDYWRQLREVYSSFVAQHQPILVHYESLKEKDEFFQRDIARNDAQIQQATELLLTLHKQWVNTTNTMAHKLHRMSTHKDELAKRCCLMKKEVKTESTRFTNMMENMVNCSQDAVEQLEDQKKKLDRIIQLAEICSKYETVDDWTVFRGVDLDVADDSADFDNLNAEMAEEYKDYIKLDKFMIKLNRAKMQAICLKTEKAKLTEENKQLKFYIKRYLTEMALRGGKDRPLSVRLQSEVRKIEATAGKALNRPVTCIEGALSIAVIHEKRMKLWERKNKESALRSYPRVQCWM